MDRFLLYVKDADSRNKMLEAAWWKANEMGSDGLISKLLSAGTCVNIRNLLGRTAMIVASGLGHVDVVKLLLKPGADLRAKIDSDAELFRFRNGRVIRRLSGS
jgi:ankyrin repeat protein